MKILRWLWLLLLFPGVAHAQFNHSLTPTGSQTLTCSNTSGTSPSLDIFIGVANSECTGSTTPYACCTGSGTGTCSKTLTGNITPTLPAAAANCIANDMIWIVAEQASTNTFTVVTAGGASTTLEYANGGGSSNVFQIPTGPAELIQNWQYFPDYPGGAAWKLVGQSTVPAAPAGAVVSVNGTIYQIAVSPTTGAVTVSQPANTMVSSSVGAGGAVPWQNTVNPAGTANGLASVEGTTAGTYSGLDVLWADSSSHRWKISTNNTTAEAVVGTSGGTQQLELNAGPATFGTTYTTGEQLVTGNSLNTCHFTELTCVNITGGSCTTAPTFNVYNGTASTHGTALTCNTTQDSGVGTAAQQSESLAITAGNNYGFYLSTQGGTCTTDEFMVTADVSCP